MKVNRWELIRLGTNRKLPTDIDVTLDLGRIDQKVKKRVIKSIERGFYTGYSGAGTEIYQLVCRYYGVPYAQLKREQSSRRYGGNHPAWRLRLQGNAGPTQALKDLQTADDTAVRMMDDQKARQQIEALRRWYLNREDWYSFFHIKDIKMLEQALEGRLSGYESQVQAARDALNQGLRISFRQTD